MKTKLEKLALPKPAFYFFLIMCSIFLFNSLNAQKNLAGFYWGGEADFTREHGWPFMGITYERKITDQFGIETGAHFNLKGSSMAASINGEISRREITYFLTNIPLLIKTYTNIVNLSGGLTPNILTVTRDKGDKDLALREDPPKDIALGYLFKVSKPFKTKPPFVLEPEISLGNRREFKEPALGAALALKYQF